MKHIPFGNMRVATTKHWFVLRVGSRKEKLVKAFLTRAGIECFVPLRERHFNYASKRVTRQLPIIPGYIFVRVDKTQTSTVLSVPFANGFLTTCGVYGQITEQELQRLRLLCSNTFIEWADDRPDHSVAAQPGSLVEIIRGPLAGLRGFFLSEVNRNTFRITLGLIETQLTTCEIDVNDVVPISEKGVEWSSQHT